MRFVTSLGLLLLGLFVLPVLVGGCLPNGRDGMPWYEARRDPTGLAPDPAGTPEAVVQVYAARSDVSNLGQSIPSYPVYFPPISGQCRVVEVEGSFRLV